MKYFAMDIGSTYLKTALIDCNELTIKLYPELRMPPAWTDTDHLCHEIDAQGVYTVIKDALDRCVHAEKACLAGILISTQMHGFLFSSPSGVPRSPYVSWQDNRCLRQTGRGKSFLEEMREKVSSERLLSHGLDLKPGLGFCNAVTARAQKSFPVQLGDYLLSLGAYVIFRLTGQPRCHMTNAAPLGLANVKQNSWDEKLIELLGLDDLQFAQIAGDTEICGYYKSEYGEIPVYADYGDQQMAVLGSLMNHTTDINLNVATAAQMAYICDDFTTGQYETRPYFEGRYLNTVTRLPSGRGLAVLIQLVEEIGSKVYGAQMDSGNIWRTVCEEVENNTADLFDCDVGYFPDLIGVNGGFISNIRHDNLTLGNLFGSVMKQYAKIYSGQIQKLVPDQDKLERLVYTGGAILRNQTLQKMIRDETGLRDAPSPSSGEVFLGHLQMALVCGGLCKNLTQAKQHVFYEDNLRCRIEKES